MVRFLVAALAYGLLIDAAFADATWQDVVSIFQQHCFDCHGPETQESGLRLDRRALLLRGGDSGEPAIIPGKSKSSHLIALVKGSNPKEAMPPDGKRLTEAEVTQLSQWIDSGAQMPKELSQATSIKTDHWSFQPVVRPHTGEGHPIDALVGARLRQA